jgi:serine/threonine protein kinase
MYQDPPYKGIESDIWVVGCIFVEIFSSKNVWEGVKDNDVINDLKKYYVPKIHKDIPKNAWSVICECLNPFKETRINAKELLEKYALICKKIKLVEIAADIGTCF